MKHALVEPLLPYLTCYAINARGLMESDPVRSPAHLTMAALADDLEVARLALDQTSPKPA